METERVSMVWPADLKEQVRELVGSRGLTEFTLGAVRDKLTSTAAGEVAQPEQLPSATSASPTPDPVTVESPGVDAAQMARQPLAARMAHARALIQQREGAGGPTGLAATLAAKDNRCPNCHDELVNGECWSCPPV